MMLVAVMHSTFEASRLINLPLMKIDSPADWSGTRLFIFVLGLALFAGGYLYLQAIRRAAKDRSIPFLAVLVVAMGLITLLIWTIKLPVPEGPVRRDDWADRPVHDRPMDDSVCSRHRFLFPRALAGRHRGSRATEALAHHPLAVLVSGDHHGHPTQTNPRMGRHPCGDRLDSPLGLFVAFSVIGGAVMWWLALPHSLSLGRGIADRARYRHRDGGVAARTLLR